MSWTTRSTIGDGSSKAAAESRSADQAARFGRLLDEHTEIVELLDRNAAMRGLAKQVREVCDAEIGLAGPIESDGLLVLRQWDGTQATGLHNLHVPVGLGLGGRAFARKQPTWVDDYCKSPLITHHFDWAISADRIRTMLAIPMARGGRVHGVVYAALREITDFSDRQLDSAAAIADSGALALQTAEAAERQQQAAASAERRRIASALHDSVGAQLFHIGAELRDLRTTLDGTSALVERLDSLQRQLAEAASAFRESIHAMDGGSQPSGTLAGTLSADCTDFQHRTGISAQVVEIGAVPECDSHRCRALIAAAREALLNVEKHAEARSVLISLVELDGGTALSITDDGNGRPHTTQQSTGIGLRTATDRVEAVGGTLSTVANDDEGLTVRVWMPAP